MTRRHDAQRLARRRILTAAGTLALSPFAAQAQTAWPTRQVTILVPSTAGGVVDISARTVQPGFSTDLGVSVVVANSPGSAGPVATAVVPAATACGYSSPRLAGMSLCAR